MWMLEMDIPYGVVFGRLVVVALEDAFHGLDG